MGRLLEIATGETPELRALFRVATKDAIYALIDAEFAKPEGSRDAATLAWLRRSMQETRWAAVGDALMSFALCRDAKVRTDGRAAQEPDVERLVATLLPRFIALNL